MIVEGILWGVSMDIATLHTFGNIAEKQAFIEGANLGIANYNEDLSDEELMPPEYDTEGEARAHAEGFDFADGYMAYKMLDDLTQKELEHILANLPGGFEDIAHLVVEKTFMQPSSKQSPDSAGHSCQAGN